MSVSESHNDLDKLLLMAEDFQLENVPEECRILSDYMMARARFHVDILGSKASLARTLFRSGWIPIKWEKTSDFDNNRWT